MADNGADRIHGSSRSDELAEELAKTIIDAQNQLRQEKGLIQVEFEAARAQLTQEYKQRLKSADDQLQELLGERVTLHSTEVQRNDVVSLNVGGQVFTVKRETLCACKDSFLADLFLGRWEANLPKDKKGHVFLDFDPHLFELLLTWLRDRNIESPDRPAALPRVIDDDLPDFQAMVDFLGLRDHLNLPGFGFDGWGTSTLTLARPQSSEGSRQKPSANRNVRGVASSMFAFLTPSCEANESQTTPGGSSSGYSSTLGSSSSSSTTPGKRSLGWSHSQRSAHPAAVCNLGDASNLVNIGDTHSLACAAAIRATRGYQQGAHYWEIKVLSVSDFSYVGFVSPEWHLLQLPIGRAPHSWGLSSNGDLHDGRHDGSVSLPVVYTSGSVVGWLLKLGDRPEKRTASVIVDGAIFKDVFSKLPEKLYPAVSNMRSPAQYSISDPTPPDSLTLGHSIHDNVSRYF